MRNSEKGVVEWTDSAIGYKEVQEYQVYWKPVWSQLQTEDNNNGGSINAAKIKT